MKLQEYMLRGNHPIMRYINWNAVGVRELDKKVAELENMGYEVKVYKIGKVDNQDGEHGPPSQPNYKGNIPS